MPPMPLFKSQKPVPKPMHNLSTDDNGGFSGLLADKVGSTSRMAVSANITGTIKSKSVSRVSTTVLNL